MNCLTYGFQNGCSIAAWDQRRNFIQLNHQRDMQRAPDCGILNPNSAFHLSALAEGNEVEFEFIRFTLPAEPQ